MNPDYLTVGASILGGGLMGAIVTSIVTSRRNRIQPVGYRKDIIPIFKKGENFPQQAEFSVIEHPLGFGERRSVDNFSLARLTLTNKGNKDFEQFICGVSLTRGKVASVQFEGADKHHEIKISLAGVNHEGEPVVPVTTTDFHMQPFNRGDTYRMNIYFTYEDWPGELT